MQQCRCRIAGHSRIAIGSAGYDPFELAQNAAHALYPVQCRDKMHLRGARIGEAHIDPAADQSAHQTFRAVHELSPISEAASSMPAVVRYFKAARDAWK